VSTSRTVAALGLGAFALACGPAITAIGPFRRRLTPRLSGAGADDHIALTYDDGPDPASTPAFLDLLARHERRATFFVLGEQAAAQPALVRRMSDAGHELAVHGWTHRCTAAVPPTRFIHELRAARRTVEDITGQPVRWYRPPYGVLSTEAVLAGRSLDLTTVLWTAWGRDWERSATPRRIVATVLRTLRPGGTILLHDTDLHARGDWRHAHEASDILLAGPLLHATVGPLRDHWQAAGRRSLAHHV
jgi:peptidoglycan/xylan/chitin deacetylase (PgdA/CDA1 family)